MEKLQWALDHWEQIGLVVAIIALACTGKWALVRAKVAELLVQNGEGEINRAFRRKVEAAAEKAPDSVREVIANLAARSDPEPAKKPESKARRFFKFVGGFAARAILKR